MANRLLAEGQSILEFSPYLHSQERTDLSTAAAASGYPDSAGASWSIAVQSRGQETVTVPAGSFNALKIEVQGQRLAHISAQASIQFAIARRFEYVAWYVPELKRYVKSRHRTWNASSGPIGDDLVELLEVRTN